MQNKQTRALSPATCVRRPGVSAEQEIECDAGARPCLFRLACTPGAEVGGEPCIADPCEKRNLAESEPAQLATMLTQLAGLNATAVPCLNNPNNGQDAWWWPAASPALHGGAWAPWYTGDANTDGRPVKPGVLSSLDDQV